MKDDEIVYSRRRVTFYNNKWNISKYLNEKVVILNSYSLWQIFLVVTILTFAITIFLTLTSPFYYVLPTHLTRC
jgi:hypothetical protein